LLYGHFAYEKAAHQVIRYAWLKRPAAAVLREVLELYQVAGWRDPGDTAGRIGRMVAGSHCFLVAREGSRVVAMGRAISDRTNDAYIQDVFVLPGFRGRGIGAQVVKRLSARLKADGLGWIGLVAAGGSWPFYARLGFEKMARHDAMRLGGK
jgi:spermidine synthase